MEFIFIDVVAKTIWSNEYENFLINKNYIKYIKDIENDDKNIYKSHIELTDGTIFLSEESIENLNKKIGKSKFTIY